MASRHSFLTGSDLHEVKGAAGATAGHVYSADGLGSASFVHPTTLENVEIVNTISNFNSANISPSGTDTPLVAGFSSTVSNTDVTMDSSGVITVNTTGVYRFTFNLNFGRSTNTSTAIVLARLLINDVQFGFTQGVTIDSNASTRPVQIDVITQASASDTYKVQIMRDSAGQNDGGLRVIAVTDTDWQDIHSYWVRVSRIQGAI